MSTTSSISNATDGSHKQRKFISAVGKPGLARQAREAVAHAVRLSAVQSTTTKKCSSVPPLDYENFVVKNRTQLENDNCREMLFFPRDDVTETTQGQQLRTTVSSVTSKHLDEARPSLFASECLKSYTAEWHLVQFNYELYGTDFAPLIKNCPSDDLSELQYEVDLANDDQNADESQTVGATYDEKIVKEGYLLKGPESSGGDHQILFKTFKRRYCFLRKDVDGSHKIDFYKDKTKSGQTTPNLKATIYLDLCIDVVKASKKGKSYLELKLNNENRKTNVYISADNEQIVDDWMTVLQLIVEKSQKAAKSAKTDDSVSVTSNQTNESDSGKEETIERLKPPDYAKFCKETDESCAVLRQNNRQNPFAVYSNLEPFLIAGNVHNFAGEKVKPLSVKFGVRFMVECKGVSIKLPLPGDLGENQVEPLFVSMFLFDARDGKRLSESFYCDVNPPSLKQFLPNFQSSSNVEKNGSVSRKSSQESPKKTSLALNSLSSFDTRGVAAEWILKLDRKALFSVTHPHSDTYLVVRVDKVLQGSVQAGQEAYVKQDAKLGQKIQKSIPVVCSKLGQYRMPFVWTAKPVFQQFIGGTESARDSSCLYRQDATKLCDEELTKLIAEIKKQEKSSKLSLLPNASIVVNIDVAVKPETLTNCCTSNYLPVVPFVEPQTGGYLTIEMESFTSASDTIMDADPYAHYSNNLYVYPIQLKYDNQRTFSKARNLCCYVEFRDSDVLSSPPLRCIYGRHGFDGSIFVNRFGTTVSHHETIPQFYDEIKIALPANVNEKHHLLFTFCHIGVESSMANKNKKESVESCVGFAWLPLVKNGKLTNEDEISLSVATSLPDGYLSCENLGLNKGFSGPEIKWVEGCRQLFKVCTRLCSTVMTRDAHLQSFFQCCQRLRDHGTLSDASSPDKTKESPVDANMPSTPPHTNNSSIEEPCRELSQSLTLVDTRCLINFLPTILNQLFSLLESAKNEELALGGVRALVHAVSEVCHANKRDILRAYIKYIFTIGDDHERTVHEELMKAATLLLRPNRTEQSTTVMFIRNLWWFLEIVVKSMCLRLLRSGRIKMVRTERFSSDFLYRVDLFVQTLVPFLCQNYKDFADECATACHSLAYFLRACLSLIDRGFVFQLIHFIFEKFDAVDSKTLKQLKIDFVQILCQHEHFVALNLPILILKNGSIFRKNVVSNSGDNSVLTNSPPAPLTKTRYGGLFQRLLSLGAGMFSATNISNQQTNCVIDEVPDTTAADVAHELRLSEEFCTNHFLVGLLLRLLDDSMNESRDLRRKTICILRNLLAKHSFDQRYRGKSQERLATLYFPLIAILIEHAPYLEVQKEITPNASPADTLTSNSGRDVSKRNTIVGDFVVSTPSFARSHKSFNPRQMSMEHIQQHSIDVVDSVETTRVNVETVSLEARGSVGSVSESSDATLVSKSVGGGRKPASSVPSMLSHTPQFLPYSRFDEEEIKDLLTCAVFVLKNVNEECLSWFWQQCSEAELVSFLKILEMCLDLFKYQGRQRIIKATSNKLRASNKTIRLSPTRDSSLLTIADPSSTKRQRRPVQTFTSNVSVDNASNLLLESPYSVLQEAHLNQEIGLVVLDCLAAFSTHQKTFLAQTHLSTTDFLERVCTLYFTLLNKHSSSELVQQTLSSLKIFVRNHTNAFLQGPTNLCNQLCRKLLDCCNWTVSHVQADACSFLYLLMRLNFESTGRKKFSRIHQQVIISLSQLLGDGRNLNNPIFNRALSIMNGYANADKANQLFASEVKEVVRRQRTVLMATSQLKEHTDDPEMLADLQKSLADSYAQSPRLRETWLENLARHHCKHCSWAEAAQCYLHIVVLICAELQKSRKLPHAFDHAKSLSDNTKNEVISSDTTGDGETYDEDALINAVKECARFTLKAERYEALGHIFRLIIPSYEKRRNYEALAEIYGTLQESYSRIVVYTKSGRRILGSYFRVVFYNQLLFEQQHNVEYVYRENKLTTLAEMADRLKIQYGLKFGADNVKLVTDSCPVNVDSLDTKTAYIQITHVEPYFEEKENLERCNEYERQTNVHRFVYETPFTTIEGRPHGASVVEQCKRRTILQTSHSFPYVVRRIEVVGRCIEELNPLQTAVDELKSRTSELKKVLLTTPSDLKHLQLRLQGCVLPTVNAGPLAYAEGFCRKEEVEKYGLQQWDLLKETFKYSHSSLGNLSSGVLQFVLRVREFVAVCYEALELNERLIGVDQIEYQHSLVKNFKEMINKLNGLFNDQILVLGYADDAQEIAHNRDSLNRQGSAVVFDYIGGVG